MFLQNAFAKGLLLIKKMSLVLSSRGNFIHSCSCIIKRSLNTLKVPVLEVPAIQRFAAYQDSFESFDQMISREKSDVKQFILLEDVSRKLKNTDPQVMSKVLDWPVLKVYKIKIPRDNVFLIKMDDYNKFHKKIKPSHVSDSLPISSRMYQVRSISNIKDAGLINEIDKPDSIQSSREHSFETELEHISQSLTLTENGSKARFFIINQLEELLCAGIFKNFVIRPFGSSVNGLGSDKSDLDLTFESNTDEGDKSSKLSYLSKSVPNARENSKNLVMSFSDIISTYIPGFNAVTPIPRARVPIIRMHSRITGLDCDISFQSPHSVEMARILFSLNKIQPLFRPLVVFGRLWVANITKNNAPGLSISNFMMTTMIISFLQTHESGPLLPAIRDLNSKIDPFHAPQVTTLALLQNLFEFLATFNYQIHGISVLNSKIMVKSTHSSLYIENPCDTEHNISRNITLEELRHFVKSAEITAKALSEQPDSIESVLEKCVPSGKTNNQGGKTKVTNRNVNIKSFWT